jgi:hypothetical protein
MSPEEEKDIEGIKSSIGILPGIFDENCSCYIITDTHELIKELFTRGEIISAMREKIDRLIQKRAIQEMLLYDRNDMAQTPKGKITPESDLELSIRALEAYSVEPAVINNMLSNLRKIVDKK